MPDPVLHPRWTLFNAPQTSPEGYSDLKLPPAPGEPGSVRLRLLTGDRSANGWPEAWISVHFRADPRLAHFVERTDKRTIGKGKRKGETTATRTYRFVDIQLGLIERPAQISGAKLIFKDIKLNVDGSLKSATPFLVFACTIDDLPLTDKARAIQWSETGEVTKTGKKRKSKKLPDGLVSCAVDLGVRNLGFLTIAVSGSASNDGVLVIRSRNQWLSEQEDHGKHTGRWSPGPDLAHIGGHKREIRRLRRLRGKPIKGEESHVELQQHIDGMGTDRFKKAARAIVNFALNIEGASNAKTGEKYPRADVLIVEKLAGFIPDSERERGINRALVAWNRGQLVNRIKEVAADAGLKIFEVHPAGTSQCCSKCGAMGRRYSIIRDDQTKLPIIRFGWVEKLFACPNPQCPGRNPEHPNRPFTCNADHNASVNLHRRFILNEQAVAASFAWRAKSDTERDVSLRTIDARLLPQLECLHGLPLSQPDFSDTPF
jgi:transposase